VEGGCVKARCLPQASAHRTYPAGVSTIVPLRVAGVLLFVTVAVKALRPAKRAAGRARRNAIDRTIERLTRGGDELYIGGVLRVILQEAAVQVDEGGGRRSGGLLGLEYRGALAFLVHPLAPRRGWGWVVCQIIGRRLEAGVR
jgi:hypothetical protein